LEIESRNPSKGEENYTARMRVNYISEKKRIDEATPSIPSD